jgi:hypothetical protein
MRTRILGFLVAGLLVGPVAANAAMFSFTYTFTAGESLSGTLSGNAAGDNVLDVALLGATFSGDPTIDFGTGLLANAVSFSGAGLDLFTTAPDPIAGKGGFVLNEPVGLVLIADPNYPPAVLEEEFDRSRWQLTAVAVPEPGTLALLGLGLLGLGLRPRALRARSTGPAGR